MYLYICLYYTISCSSLRRMNCHGYLRLEASPLQPLWIRRDRYGGGGSQLQTPYSYIWEAACANDLVRCSRFSLFTLRDPALPRRDIARVASTKEKRRRKKEEEHCQPYEVRIWINRNNIGHRGDRDPHRSQGRQVC